MARIRTWCRGGVVVLTLLGGSTLAEVPEPDHVFYGIPTLFGEAAEGSQVTVRINDDPTVLASFEIGSRPELGNTFVLRVPMDSSGPREAGHARSGDVAKFFIDDEPAGQRVISDRGTATRLNIDPQSVVGRTLSIADVSANEGDSGTTVLTFVVTLSEAADFDIEANWTTADNTATLGDSDYVGDNGVVTFSPGDTEVGIDVTVNGDTDVEMDESFFVNLTRPAAMDGIYEFADATGLGTILDDDTPPGLSVADLNVPEGDAEAIFRVSLTHEWDQNVSFSFATANGTATAGSDYLANSGSATIVAGELVTTVVVDLLADTEDENDETFFLNLTAPVNATLLDPQGMATIIDDQRFLLYSGQEKNNDGGVSGLDGPKGLAVSPDGDHVYAAGFALGTVVVFNRTGPTLTQQQVLQDDPAPAAPLPGATVVDGLGGAWDVAVSPDGKHVYVAGYQDDSLVVFSRNTDDMSPSYGNLSFVETLSNGQVQGPVTIDGLTKPKALVITPDPDGNGPEMSGTHLYVVGRARDDLNNVVGSVAVFERDPSTGELTFVEVEVQGVDDPGDFGGMVQGLLGAGSADISPDATNLYVTGELSGAVAVFDREADSAEGDFGRLNYKTKYSNSTGTPVVSALEGASSVQVSPIGNLVFVAGGGIDGGVATFDRETDGSLTFRRSLAADSQNGLLGVADIQLSRDALFLYAVASDGDVLSAFRRVGRRLDFIETHRDGLGGVDGLWKPVALAVSPDDAHVLVSGQLDDAVAVFTRDLDDPTNPSVTSTTHTVDEWSNDEQIVMQWSGAADVGHAGLEGYSFLFDTSPSTSPDTTVDLPHTQDPHSTAAIPTPAEGDSHFFHLRTCDRSGNCAAGVDVGPFKIDLTPPSDPTLVESTTHLVSTPSTNARITVRWTGAVDPAIGADPDGSGLSGYGVTFSPQSSPSICSDTLNVLHAPDGLGFITVESGPLFNGTYYVHLCTRDAAGNWSPGITPLGPFIVQTSDTAAPTVTLVDSVSSSEGEIEPGEQVLSTVTQLLVSYSEAMFDPGDSTNPNSVRNPSNYLLLTRSDEAPFETAVCGPPQGDDTAVAIDAVLWDGTQIAALQLNGGFALEPGRYRLTVCGDALADPSGNFLDGDLDGADGGNLVRSFEVIRDNFLLNPNFDAGDLSFWSDLPPNTPDVSPQTDVDAADAFSSGSALVEVQGASSGEVFGVTQCVRLGTVIAGMTRLSGLVRIASDPSYLPMATGSVEFFEGTTCETPIPGSTRVTDVAAGDTGGLFVELLDPMVAVPPAAGSALVSFVATRDESAGEVFDANFDDLYFGGAIVEGLLFYDGFESGDTTGWSSSTP